MEKDSAILSTPEISLEEDRLIGHFKGEKEGLTLVLIGGLHGNEPSGLLALKQVLAVLNAKKPEISGQIFALAGNLSAIRDGKRFHESDLNRLWTPERMEKVEKGIAPDELPDTHEQLALHKTIRTIFDEAPGPVMLIDLHTTSAVTSPFIAINDTLLNRTFSNKFPLPIILGIEEYLQGPLLNYISEIGYPSVVFEAGQHDSPSSFENHRAFIWLALFYTKMIGLKHLPKYERYYQRLKTAAGRNKGVFDILYRKAVTDAEQFKMKRGFMNFQPIQKGQLLAENGLGEIFSPQKGFIFMPLYQKQGEDGYFIIRRISLLWLALSTRLRNFHFENFLVLLPGISRHKERTYQLRVNLSVARLLAKDIFHLLGYRIKLQEDKYLYLARREFDMRDKNGIKYRF